MRLRALTWAADMGILMGQRWNQSRQTPSRGRALGRKVCKLGSTRGPALGMQRGEPQLTERTGKLKGRPVKRDAYHDAKH
jgi:hypothetical protein